MSKNDEFIEKAKSVHGDKYDYSKVEYISSKTKIIIICKDHGDFIQRPSDHINRKSGCPKCKGKSRRTDTNTFIEKAKSVHGDKYDYSKVEYINVDTKILIICPIHGEFYQTPYTHINQKCGCNICSRELKKNRIISLNNSKMPLFCLQ